MKTNILGIYEDEKVLTDAVDKLQAQGVTISDVFSPIPLHGIWEKLNLTTRLPLATFLYGAFGAALTFAFLFWTSVVSYPLKFGGKPLNTLSFIIIMFVLTINIGTLFTFITYFVREKMFPGKQVKLDVPRTTDDQFTIVIERPLDMSLDEEKKINALLKETGAVEVIETNN
ncbi:MAG: DUF3341 domain-containing protein [Bacteroidales bacterium]|nr:DUF3341 domain-containing protein [Bacteroidales bacterium]